MLYQEPIMEILELDVKDVICTSIDNNTGDNFTPTPSGPWG